MALAMPTSLGTREVVDLSATTFNLQRLESPNICLHECGTKYGPQLIRSIFEKLEVRGQKCGFEEINLNDNKIGDEGAHYLAEGLTGNKALKKLYLARCDIGAKGFEDLGKMLADAPALEEILLSSNTVDSTGLDGAFNDGLKKNTQLKSLYLGACRLGSEGIKKICEGALKSHPALEHVSLTYNRIDVTGAQYLSAALSSNKVLQYLDLSGNALGPEGAVALVTGLKANKGKLQKLSVAQNRLRLEGAKALAQFFTSAEGSKMEFLDLRHNLVTYKGFMEMRKMLNRTEESDTWLLLFGARQLFLNAH